MVSLNAAVAAFALTAGGPTVMYDFYADWCGPCRAMSPTVEAMAAKGFPVQKVNIDQRPDLKQKYRIGPIPCFVMVVDGREVDRQVGMTSPDRLEQMCRLGAQTNAAANLANVSHNPAGPPAAAPRAVPVSWNAPSDSGGLSDEQLLAVTVRLRVADPRGFGWGTGTIIDSRQGEALILTCGHLFRDSQGKGQIDVDLFGPYAGQRVTGHLIGYDLKRDVALVSMRTPGPIQAARLAPPDYVARPGDPVIGVGCSNGDNPTVAHSRVASVNRFLGPPNLQVTGEPIEGRSGGGLFSPQGLVIGVCNGAQHDDHEGFFAALGSIYGHVGDVGLAHVFQSPPPATTAPATSDPALLASSSPGGIPVMPKSMPPASPPSGLENLPQPGPSIQAAVSPTVGSGFSRPLAAVGGPPAMAEEEPMSKTEQAALDEIRRRLDDGAEVVCVIRSRNDPTARSEIIMLDRVSPAFLKELAGEAQRGAEPGTAERAIAATRRTLPAIERTSAQQPTIVTRWNPTEGRWNSRPRVVAVQPPVDSQARAD